MRVLFSLLLFYTLQSSLLFAATNTELLLSKKGFCDTIKISYINGHIYVPVKINNKEYKFLFDTGARDFMLDSANGNIVKEQQGSILFYRRWPCGLQRVGQGPGIRIPHADRTASDRGSG